jgi:hypothetical protein
MKRALIGYSGFVGGNLRSQMTFEEEYNSLNIDQIAGKSFDLVVCAGAKAEKWKANKDPEGDLQHIEFLIKHLASIEAKRFILISTVDVYSHPIQVDEDFQADENHPEAYGRHRARLERFVRERFSSLIIRLPGLFGSGLKKNIIYDFLHNNDIQRIHPESLFQFYALHHLAADIDIAQSHSINLLNLATEPTSVLEISRFAFQKEFQNIPPGKPVRYDMRTRHAGLFGGSTGYAYSKERVLAELKEFVELQRASPA